MVSVVTAQPCYCSTKAIWKIWKRRAWLCSSKILFTKADSRLDLAQACSSLIPYLEDNYLWLLLLGWVRAEPPNSSVFLTDGLEVHSSIDFPYVDVVTQ